MTSSNIISLLKEKRLRLTEGRKEILEVLYGSEEALSHRDIEKLIVVPIDRITTYRTLVSFKKKGLVHAIVDPYSATVKYSINKPGIPYHHAHFKCKSCNALTCLPLDIEKMNLILNPSGYLATAYSFYMEGTCDKCRSNH